MSRRSRRGSRIISSAKPAVVARPHQRRRAAVGSAVRRRAAASARVRAGRAASSGPRSSRATRSGSERRLRADEPRRAEDDRLGVLRVSARRVHDAARHRGSHPGDVDHGVVDVPAGDDRLRGARRGSARALVETFAAHESRSVQHTLYAMGEAALAACADVTRDHADAAEPAPSARRSDAVRPRQPERDLRRDRPAVRVDRSDDTSGRTAEAVALRCTVRGRRERLQPSRGDTMAADLSTTFTGVRFQNPFLLSSAPPTESESNILRAFEAGWGGVVTKTIGLHPVVNVARAEDEVPARRRRFGAPVDEEASRRRAALVVELGAHLRQDARLVGAAARPDQAGVSRSRARGVDHGRLGQRHRAAALAGAGAWRARSRAATRSS